MHEFGHIRGFPVKKMHGETGKSQEKYAENRKNVF